MNKRYWQITVLLVVLLLAISACAGKPEAQLEMQPLQVATETIPPSYEYMQLWTITEQVVAPDDYVTWQSEVVRVDGLMVVGTDGQRFDALTFLNLKGSEGWRVIQVQDLGDGHSLVLMEKEVLK